MTRALIVLALAVGSCGALAPSAQQVSENLVVMLVGEDWLGYGACRSKPTIWIRGDVIGTPEGPQVLAHELAHLETMRSFPSCAAYEDWIVQPGNRALFEAHGHCAGAIVDRITGRVNTWDGAIQMHGARLAHARAYARLGLSEPEAEALIRRFCTVDPKVRE